MNNRFKAILLLFLCSTFFFSCGEDEEAEPITLSLSEEILNFNAEGGSQTFSITSNSSWTIETSVLNAEVTPRSGTGNGEVTVTLGLNDIETSITFYVEVKAGSIQKEVAVVQEPAEPQFPDYYIPADQTGMRDVPNLELAMDMGYGWNLGNTLEAIGGETAWGNPKATQELIDAVKAAGFNSVRIPVAWSKFSNPATFEIDPAWMARVTEVVDYVIANDMYALLNIHWDEGWMQPTYAQQDYVNDRLEKMWIQIALNFRDYEDHLLFAGTNEVMVEGDYGTPIPEYYQVQNSFNQTFVDAVRSTGGRNSYRNLVVQTFNTNIDHGVNFFELPEDKTAGRLMVEAHYYDPYEFALQENETITQWGENATDPSRKANWGDEAHADAQFMKMKTNFVDKGIPVLMGEYGAVLKKAGEHHEYLKDYLKYITESMGRHGLVPFYWDNGYAGDYGFALFDRQSGEQIHPDLIKAVTGQ
ncbi:cellulase family glycosylhydrolase [Algoriphagus halophytocola]|uniref:Cellulase family glycosylhydrolase n=1 Tax=Algoriphagus halophytocola TaxID=2991499 RepID=A0ABY6MI27_9BACT|nr:MULTISPECIES: cellulase family glycosylhydrolase [unclassified Algoriphagus]UZD22634.1 cellulase family glycosylhydrolase [Algoriphagus sp. TR-M5]WBL43900.1 cellulase family glycosylhydrolase [Algoriphagus sp. TR-M9]